MTLLVCMVINRNDSVIIFPVAREEIGLVCSSEDNHASMSYPQHEAFTHNYQVSYPRYPQK
ncbi:hypothetical protein [Terrihalobacillus insolitus]|uniref:hypothetical protein n=1 Tax=Terrihalobacillus insolitus TaxID=2950438 RepID=UPI00233F819B|nr:hypothetical protein [Terrihalobacillus insolitus]MDC3413434.1 hypothetical protein [Terrihalobacillus insolitus]